MSLEWETIIPSKNAQYTQRLKVWKGWLVKSVCDSGNPNMIAMCFIPDENHQWVINEK